MNKPHYGWFKMQYVSDDRSEISKYVNDAMVADAIYCVNNNRHYHHKSKSQKINEANYLLHTYIINNKALLNQLVNDYNTYINKQGWMEF